MQATQSTQARAQSIEAIALDVRQEMEGYFAGNPGGLNDMCSVVARELCKRLRQEGLNAVLVLGMYLGADDAYVPDLIEADEHDPSMHERSAGFAHWWVAVDGMVVDAAVDQFHPNEGQSKRVVIVSETDVNYRAIDKRLDDESTGAVGALS